MNRKQVMAGNKLFGKDVIYTLVTLSSSCTYLRKVRAKTWRLLLKKVVNNIFSMCFLFWGVFPISFNCLGKCCNTFSVNRHKCFVDYKTVFKFLCKSMSNIATVLKTESVAGHYWMIVTYIRLLWWQRWKCNKCRSAMFAWYPICSIRSESALISI